MWKIRFKYKCLLKINSLSKFYIVKNISYEIKKSIYRKIEINLKGIILYEINYLHVLIGKQVVRFALFYFTNLVPKLFK